MSYLQSAFESDTFKKLTNGKPTDFSCVVGQHK